jgi:N-acetylglucosaminyl-diphospho-decaprenol L-rhamnosyltransferase
MATWFADWPTSLEREDISHKLSLMSPDLTVIFINYNSAGFLDRALSSLHDAEPRLRYEVLVVDNGSRDRAELVDVCRRRVARLVLLGRNLGYGAAFNRGYRHASGRYVAIANSDIVFSAPAMSGLVRFMDERPDAGAVSPQLHYPDGTPQPSARRLPRLRYILAGRRSPLARVLPRYSAARDFQYADAHLAAEPVPVEAIIGTLVVFRRTALDQVAGFDERFFMYAEDMDICRRISRSGWGVYLEPRLVVEHFYGGVRRRFQQFGDYQRLKALMRYLTCDRAWPGRLALRVAFAAYLSISEAGWLVGLREFEYSWQSALRRA